MSHDAPTRHPRNCRTITPADPGRSPILRYFSIVHLAPGPLRQTSAWFADLAVLIDDALPHGPEKSTALRELLEAKDCAVRAALDLTSEAQK